MNAKQTVEKLEAAISAYQGDTGPVTWRAEDHGGDVLLVGTYDADTRTDTDDKELYLTDEVWKLYGGDAILESAGLEMSDSGMDAYQDTWGDNVVSQWVSIDCTE